MMMGAGVGAAATQRNDTIGQVTSTVAGTAVTALEVANKVNNDLRITETATNVAMGAVNEVKRINDETGFTRQASELVSTGKDIAVNT